MPLECVPTRFPEARLFRAAVHADARGTFARAFSRGEYAAFGIRDDFVEDNVSVSATGVLRGMHYDFRLSKFVQVLAGRAFDAIVDVRRGSPTFGQWDAFELSGENHAQLYVPRGFAHGFYALEGPVVFLYKQSAAYDPAAEGQVRYDDPAVGIAWPFTGEPLLSEKDRSAAGLDAVP